MLTLNAAALLIDAWAPGEHGGTGKTLDWTAIGDIGRPWLLAGGLTPDNVAEAIAVARPYAVDVSSGVESERGEKIYLRLSLFCRQCRRGMGKGEIRGCLSVRKTIRQYE